MKRYRREVITQVCGISPYANEIEQSIDKATVRCLEILTGTFLSTAWIIESYNIVAVPSVDTLTVPYIAVCMVGRTEVEEEAPADDRD